MKKRILIALFALIALMTGVFLLNNYKMNNKSYYDDDYNIIYESNMQGRNIGRWSMLKYLQETKQLCDSVPKIDMKRLLEIEENLKNK